MNTISFDQSKFFKWIYDEEYGTYGGEAFSTLLFNFHIQKKDLTLLTKISEVCALSHCLSLFGIDAEFFNLKDFTQINQLNSVNRLFESKEYISFKKLRDNENSQYIALLFPRFIGRLPYHPDLNPAKNLPNFIEDMSDHENFLWINVVFAYAQRLAESFSQYQWFSTIAGPENGGNVDELPNYFYKDKGELVIKCPTETIITERQEKQFSDNGFICLCYCKNTDKATFFGSQTLHKPLVFYDNYATSNASLKCKIQSILNASLFAHAIKIMLMNKIGGFSSKSSLQKFINNWLTNYVLLNAESTSDETKALYPLQNAEVEVEENPALPGVYHSIVRITPHYQMDSATVSLRIVAKKGDK